MYGDALKNAGELTNENTEATANAIAEAYKFNKAYNQGRKLYENNKDAIEEYADAMQHGHDVSYDVADSVGEVVDQLKNMGLILTSNDFKSEETVGQLNKLLNGTREEAEEAYKALEKISQMNSLSEAFSGKLDLSNYQSQIEGIVNSINSLTFDENGIATFQNE